MKKNQLWRRGQLSMTNVSFNQSTSNLHQLKGTFDFAAYAGSPNKIKHIGKRFLCRINHMCNRAHFYYYHKTATPYSNIVRQMKNLVHRHNTIWTCRDCNELYMTRLKIITFVLKR